MQTSVIGFPRVGALRELKFTTEKFFKGLVSEQELEALAKDIRKKQWLKMQEKEVDFIPSNDFSFYDNFLEECKADTLKIGLSFFPAEPLIKDVREGDIPLDYVVTPEGIFKF